MIIITVILSAAMGALITFLISKNELKREEAIRTEAFNDGRTKVSQELLQKSEAEIIIWHRANKTN